jgi:hypothetical protein
MEYQSIPLLLWIVIIQSLIYLTFGNLLWMSLSTIFVLSKIKKEISFKFNLLEPNFNASIQPMSKLSINCALLPSAGLLGFFMLISVIKEILFVNIKNILIASSFYIIFETSLLFISTYQINQIIVYARSNVFDNLSRKYSDILNLDLIDKNRNDIILNYLKLNNLYTYEKRLSKIKTWPLNIVGILQIIIINTLSIILFIIEMYVELHL